MRSVIIATFAILALLAVAFLAFAAYLVSSGHPVFAIFAFIGAICCVPSGASKDAA